MQWHGAYKLRNVLGKAISDNQYRPPDTGKGIYVITRRRWRNEPKTRSCVLYVGGSTGKSRRFRTRIGDLIADMLGFFGEETEHHSGGKNLWKWCHDENVHPLDLYIGWKEQVSCKRCAEIEAYEALKPRLNKRCPSRCSTHHRQASRCHLADT